MEVPLSHSYFIRDVRLQGNVRLLYIHVGLFLSSIKQMQSYKGTCNIISTIVIYLSHSSEQPYTSFTHATYSHVIVSVSFNGIPKIYVLTEQISMLPSLGAIIDLNIFSFL